MKKLEDDKPLTRTIKIRLSERQYNRLKILSEIYTDDISKYIRYAIFNCKRKYLKKK